MTTPTEQPEALRLADALAYCDNHVASRAAAELRRIDAAREADRKVMEEALNALIAMRDAIPDLHSYGNLAGNTLGSRVDAAIKALEQRVGES